MKFRLPIIALSLALGWISPVSTVAAPAPDGLITVSRATSPQVSYGIRNQGDDLLLVIDAGSFEAGGKGVSVTVGVSADRVITLDGDTAAQISYGKNHTRFTFSIPGSRLVDSAAGWKKLRLAFAVSWAGGPDGQARLRERFLHITPGAAHTGVSPNTADWLPIDLAEVERFAADRAQEIVIDFPQPLDGKATIVIDDAKGKRIRNLISAQVFSKGKHRIVWDGLDEAGNVIAPGAYSWRSISHPGLAPKHLFDFVDTPGSNHSTLHAAAFNGSSLFFAAPVSEGGFEFVEFAPDGTFKRGFNPPHGHGLRDVALAVDDTYLYAAHDGRAWSYKVDTTKPDWKATNTISLMRVDVKSWDIAEFPGKVRYASLATVEVGPGSEGARPDVRALAGMALFSGRLYVGDSVNNQVMVIDPATAQIERTFPLDSPVALAASAQGLYAIAGGKLIELKPDSGQVREIAALTGKPEGLTVGPDGRFFVADQQDQVVRVFTSTGRPSGIIGEPGGVVTGPYNSLKFHNPRGLVFAEDRLWMTEVDRWAPKRLSSYDIASGKVLNEFFGPTNYGSQGAGFDYADHTRWIGQGTLFDIDFKTGKSKALAILGGEDTRRHTFWRQDGRTFVISSGKATFIQELTAAGLKPHALISSAHQYSYSKSWQPPQAFLEAFTKTYPNEKLTIDETGTLNRGQPGKGFGMLWVDKNGDGEMQTEEIEFATTADRLAGSGWSHDLHDLTIRVPAMVGGKTVLVTLKPDGWWPGGAPKYPALNDAVKAGIPVNNTGPHQVESAVDRFGNTILNSNPLTAYAPDGRQLWTYRNEWSGVHGSHEAPLPLVGQLQGVLFFSGVVHLDDQSDVMLMNGNHGQAFIMTTDGLYIDAIFPDVRMMSNPQAGGVGVLGGECFGGTFGYSEKDGNYYFQGGGIAYRIYRVDGLRDTKRGGGKLQVTAAQAAAAERGQHRLVAESSPLRTATAGWTGTPLVIDGLDDDWADIPSTNWDKGGRFPVKVRMASDAKMLYLHYTVRDESPWVNQGKDWQALFKTGDGIDFQFGPGASANPMRGGPVPGDTRLFIAPSANGDVAVLYRHRVPGARESEGVVFQSPWRSEKVDVVRKLTSAKIAVQRGNNEYRVEVAVPLAEFSLPSLAGAKVRGDFGVIYGDGEGTTNVFRNYWSNQATGLVNDVPGEIMLTPSLWGDIIFDAAVRDGGAR